MMALFGRLALASAASCLLLIALGTPRAQADAAPPTPVFADNYRVHGLLSLPYAELNEPFSAYYDKALDRSRTDYFGGEYQVYQFSPRSSPERRASLADDNNYGAIYKLLYVPANFHLKGEPRAPAASGAGRLIASALEHLPFRHHAAAAAGAAAKAHTDDTDTDMDADANAKANADAKPQVTPTKRACFGVQGSVGSTIGAQSVVPDLRDFAYDSTGRCPHAAGSEHGGRGAPLPTGRVQHKCELWKLNTSVGDKKNVYKFWLRRDPANESLAIPVHYYMLGYDSLLGSHYDRYDISYFHYQAEGALDEDFALDVQGNRCASMPGPGDDSSESERRAHLIVQNPIHEFVVQPHRYDHVDHHFGKLQAKFAERFARKYANERDQRKGWFNFLHNLRFIHGKNRELRDYKLQVNQFADENVRELRYLRGRLHSTGYNGGLDYAEHHARQLLKGADGKLAKPLPDSFDWTALGAVTPVKDQAVCGSCWSFGTSGAMEGAYFARTGKLLKLSQQQLIDCSWQFGNNGCDGGEDFRAYAYIKEAGGLSTEEDYGHYKGIDGRCHDRDVPKPAKISGFYNVTMNSVEALKHAIVNYGPVSISIDASRPTFTFYSHGAYYDDKCKNSPDSLDHSVLAVGYTHLNGKLVWKVKNSWSTYWGNDGYIYMAADNNNCGVLDAPTVPIIVAS